jgi:hypothetical protein
MGVPFYVFAIAIVFLIVAIVMTCFVTKKVVVEKILEAEGGQEEDDKIEPEIKIGCVENFRNTMMWNFFIMFFYEASLEVTMSLVVGYNYLKKYDKSPESAEFNTNNSRNSSTREIHRICFFSFVAM